MGCVNSAPVDDGQGGKISKEEAAKQQRRRLSVTPAHVGDISPDKGQPVKEEVKQEAINEAALVKSAPAEAPAKSKIRSVSVSKKGFVPYNRNKVNQDRELIKWKLQDDAGIDLFGVMDGHGEFGHFVANFVKEKLPGHLEKQTDLRKDPPNAITRGVKALVDELAETNINTAFSGTTCVFGLRVDDQIYVANIGDSRCVLGRKNEKGQVVGIPLSIDQKPENPEEKARIIRAGGRVEPLPGPPGEDCGPPRVWLAEVDVPGLAMSRSIGDEVSQTVGVISVPDIQRHTIDPAQDVFMVWATDGVWEFISDQEATDLIEKNRKASGIQKSADELVAAAHDRWTKEEEVVDDITCVIIEFLPDNSS